MFTTEKIARIVHAANNELRAQLNEPLQTWEDLTEGERAGVRTGIELTVAHPEMTPEDSHASWCRFKFEQGWVHGPVKDAVAKTHPCIVAYHELPAAQRAKDYLFQGIVRALLQAQKVLAA